MNAPRNLTNSTDPVSSLFVKLPVKAVFGFVFDIVLSVLSRFAEERDDTFDYCACTDPEGGVGGGRGSGPPPEKSQKYRVS